MLRCFFRTENILRRVGLKVIRNGVRSVVLCVFLRSFLRIVLF